MHPIIPVGHPFYPLLEKCLDYNYPPLKPQDDVSTPIENPLAFYDRHISSNLTLKAVKLTSSLPRYLAHICDASFEQFIKSGNRLDDKGFPHHFGDPEDMHYATSVGEQYRQSVAEERLAFVSRLCLYPKTPRWKSLFSFATFDHQSEASDPFLTEGRAYAIYESISSNEYLKFLQDTVDQETQDMINDIPRMYKWLAVWSFFALTKSGESVLSRMDSIADFKWEGVHTVGGSAASSFPPPLDAGNGFLVDKMRQRTRRIPKRAMNAQNSHWENTSNVHDGKKTSKQKAAQIRLPGRRGLTKRSYRPNAKDYIQKTWATAVKYDSTFMVFNCGSYERIGMRHRASQTLYLSDLINTSHTSPKYGTIHMGLYLAIIQDIIERRKSKKSEELLSASGVRNKRSAEHLESLDAPPSKRTKHTSEIPLKAYNEGGHHPVNDVEKEISFRELALIRLEYDTYCSPMPSSFIREGQSCVPGLFSETFERPNRKATYGSQDFMTITLGKPIGKGAIGVVHQAMIEVETSSGQSLYLSCLVKLVFKEKDYEATRQEFEVYKWLAGKKVSEGIVSVYGLFQDIETGTLALVMGHGGRTLRTIKEEINPEFIDHEISVTEEEFAIYLRILEGIHRAGVVHCDVRLDNIVINDSNEISIIDFDRAMLFSDSEALEHPEAFEHEIYDLQQILGHSDETETEGDSGGETTGEDNNEEVGDGENTPQNLLSD